MPLVAAIMVSCSGNSSPAPPPPSSPAAAASGSQSVAWEQPAFDIRDLEQLSYLAYIDGARVPLTSVTCDTVATTSGFPCVSRLPALAAGRHVVELSALGTYGALQLESARSSVTLTVGQGSSVTAAAVTMPRTHAASKAVEIEEPLTVTTEDGVTFSVEKYAGHLDGPVAMTLTTDGLIIVIEGRRQIRILGGQESSSGPALTLNDVLERGERGALVDVTASSDFARTRLVYVLSIAQRTAAPPVYRLSRFRELNGTLGQGAVLLDGVPVSAHGRPEAIVRFGPDRRLYLAFQDLDDHVAQDLGTPNGKILRLAEDGGIPEDNPRHSPVFSSGHAVPAGLAWQPSSGALWETEGALIGSDRLNLIVANRDYGWPDSRRASPDAVSTRVALGESLDPAGAAFYTAPNIPQFHGDLFFVSRARRALYRVRFDPADRRRVLSVEPLLENRLGRLGGVVSGPDGSAYLFTSNRNGSGEDGPGQDCIFRIRPSL
jgi:glucose/arabinose dehydrogenase